MFLDTYWNPRGGGRKVRRRDRGGPCCGVFSFLHLKLPLPPSNPSFHFFLLTFLPSHLPHPIFLSSQITHFSVEELDIFCLLGPSFPQTLLTNSFLSRCYFLPCYSSPQKNRAGIYLYFMKVLCVVETRTLVSRSVSIPLSFSFVRRTH